MSLTRFFYHVNNMIMNHPDKYIKREIESKLEKISLQFPAVALTGPRQSGKSTLLKKLFGKTHDLISFDDPIVRQKALSDPVGLLERGGKKLILDEIQYVPQILSYIKMMIDEERDKYGRFIITGSQKFTLIKNLSETLAGRIALFELLPFSFGELSSTSKAGAKEDEQYFTEACLRGSFPEPRSRPELDAYSWYSGYIQTFLEKDIRTIYNIGDLNTFQSFLKLLAGRCAQVLNMDNISKELGVSANTIKSWVSVLEANNTVFLLQPYHANIGKRLTKNPKIYFTDCGLVCHLTGIRNKEALLEGLLAGPLFENYIIQETIKVFFNKGERPDIYFLRTKNLEEIDLLVKIGEKYYPFEIKLTKTPSHNILRMNEELVNRLKIPELQKPGIICLGKDDTHMKILNAFSVKKYIDFIKTKS